MRGVAGMAVLVVGGCVAACAATSEVPAVVGQDAPTSMRTDALTVAGDAERRPSCVVTDRLIPTCGAWWGIAPEVFTGRGPLRATELAERRMGRRADIVHVYHRNGELFPTAEERELAKGRRLLLINWKPSLAHSWAEIARGAVDRRIDRLADHIKRTFHSRFFLTVHHEPENDVNRGPGYSATDYAAMYRHVIVRLRARGVRTMVTVMTYMGAPNWASQPWFEQLYPGDDVVDWVALDPYADARVNDLAGLVNKTRADYPHWPGFYRWMQARFPAKPIMIAEWGAFERPGRPGFKRNFFLAVQRQLADYPQIKAMVYFDSPLAPRGDTRFDTTPAASRAFARLSRDRRFTSTAVPLR